MYCRLSINHVDFMYILIVPHNHPMNQVFILDYLLIYLINLFMLFPHFTPEDTETPRGLVIVQEENKNEMELGLEPESVLIPRPTFLTTTLCLHKIIYVLKLMQKSNNVISSHIFVLLKIYIFCN